MDSKHEKRGKNDRNLVASTVACASAIQALCYLLDAVSEGHHLEVAGPPATSPATVEPVAAEPLVLVPDDGAGTDAPDVAQRFELPLKPGEFEWHPEASPAGDVVMLVSLPMQEIHVYRGDVRIGRASISSGKAGHDTPVGAFPILQKRKVHHSSLYDDAPMPFMQRLTWDGIALHAGKNPGYPASHGCIRLPHEFAKLLFDATDHGQVVLVADYTMFGDDVLSPGPVAPPKLLAVARSALEPEEHVESLASTGG